jgi:adenosylhomocysteine nucleosidase
MGGGGSYDGAIQMPGTIAIIAALPREIAAVVRGTKADAALVKDGVWLYRVDGAVVVAAGMGAERAAAAVSAALGAADVGTLISTGLAGGCVAGVVAGSVLEAGLVVDAVTGEGFVAGAGAGATLASAGAIASVREKASLAERFGAVMVDMEAAAVARIARKNGLRFRAIKGVSDGYEFELSSLAKFEGERGSFRTGAFAAYTAVRPWTWGKAVELGRGSSRALAGLAVTVRRAMADEHSLGG